MLHFWRKRHLAWSLIFPLILYLLLSGALVLALTQSLDRVVTQLTDSVGLEELDIEPKTLEWLRVGTLLLGALGIFFGLTLVISLQFVSRRHKARLERAFWQALGQDGSSGADGGESGDDQEQQNSYRFDNPLGAMEHLGQELKQERQGAAVNRARLSRLADLLDVGVLLFNAERKPELASSSALRLLNVEGDLPSEDTSQKLFKALVDENGEIPDLAVAEIEISKSPQPVCVRVQLFHLDESCDHGYLVLLRDRNVLDALDTDLRLATQLRGMTRLYLGVAHDLKAPLNAMGLNLALLRSSLRTEASDEDVQRRTWLGIVEVELKRLQREVERLLAQTAPSRDKVSPYDLRTVLEGIRDLLLPQAKQQGIRVELELPEKSTVLLGREDLVKQALLNVALNALEAAPDGGKVALVLKRRGEKSVSVQISDNGDGIPEENREHIFEMHFTTKEKGTGVGLYIARSILEAEGGELMLNESSESGTILECHLPLK